MGHDLRRELDLIRLSVGRWDEAASVRSAVPNQPGGMPSADAAQRAGREQLTGAIHAIASALADLDRRIEAIEQRLQIRS
jgi:hypothetical protein